MSSSSPTDPPPEPAIDLKNPWLAAGLALLVPGLGHLYQGRTFKAAVYCVCILGLFFTGQALGEWKVVYLANDESAGRLGVGKRVEIVGRLLQGYGAQFPVGVAAWPALVQSRRYEDPSNIDRVDITAPLSAPFRGGIWIDSAHEGPIRLARLEGTVSLEERGRAVVGRFVGMAPEDREVTLNFSRVVELGREVGAGEGRPIVAGLENVPEWVMIPEEPGISDDAEPYFMGDLKRPFWDHYQVPLGETGEDRLVAELGAEAEIAWVFTWIAGLLNVLAIWDALDGPAYGYGSEREKKRKRRKNEEPAEEPADSTPPQPEPVARSV